MAAMRALIFKVKTFEESKFRLTTAEQSTQCVRARCHAAFVCFLRAHATELTAPSAPMGAAIATTPLAARFIRQQNDANWLYLDEENC